MSMEYIEFSEKTLDDAITTACQKLGVTSDRLEYEVIDHGSQGFLGFNARKAVIKARVKDEKTVGDVLKNTAANDFAEETAEEAPAAEEVTAPEEAPAAESDFTEESPRKQGGRHGRHERPRREKREYREPEKKYEAPVKKDEPKVVFTAEQVAEAKKRAEDFLKDVFEAMDMDVTIASDFDEEENILNISFEGEETGVLIGKRGQTLDSLQYLVSLVVNKGVEGYIHVKTDTENYRERRKKTLENLARNISFKVKKSRRAVALEPMNPYERRIIHSALQNDKYVTTYSEGEDPYRKVIIAPKKN